MTQKRHYRVHLARCLMGVALLAQLPGQAQAAEWPPALGLGTVDGTTGFQLDGVAAGDYSGYSVAAAGDVNGDGFGDVIVGAHSADTNGATAGDRHGASYVVFGTAGGFPSALNLSNLNGTTGFRLDGVAAYDRSGYSVAAAGDVNGDGFGDVIVGAPFADPNGNDQAGSSFVVFGKAGGFPSAVNLSTLNGSTGFRLDGVAEDDKSGTSVAAAGDVNGDGFGDVIVGAYLTDPNGNNNAGSSYVVFGKAGGFQSAVNLSALNGTTGFRLDGVTAEDRSGYSVAAAGDVNGDGFGDVIVGASSVDTNGASAGDAQGASYVVFGKAGGFQPVVSLSTLNGSTGFRLDGVTADDGSGVSVAAAGDVNGDGFGDVIVGATGVDTNGATAGDKHGASYVVFGKADGFQPAVNLSTLNGSTGFRLDGVTAGDYSGRSVATAGDVNGDGFGDVIVGAFKVNSNGNDFSGSSYVVFGKAGGFQSTVNLSTIDGITGFRLDGVGAYDYSGRSVAAAGDVNGDGFGDVIVGAYAADPNSNAKSGSSYVVFGRAPDASAFRVGSRARQAIQGGGFADVLVAADAGDVLEGREAGDVLVGGIATTASYAHAASAVTANLGTGVGTGAALGDSYILITNLEGSALNDTLTGDAKSNVILGGKGKDLLKGSGGKDTFAYRLSMESPPGSTTRDQVLDFNPGKSSSAVDKIDLSGIDAKTSKGGNQAFTFRGTKAFNGSGQVRLKMSGSDVIIQGNTGGSKSPEFEIVLKGLASKIGKITTKDFKL